MQSPKCHGALYVLYFIEYSQYFSRSGKTCIFFNRIQDDSRRIDSTVFPMFFLRISKTCFYFYMHEFKNPHIRTPVRQRGTPSTSRIFHISLSQHSMVGALECLGWVTVGDTLTRLQNRDFVLAFFVCCHVEFRFCLD